MVLWFLFCFVLWARHKYLQGLHNVFKERSIMRKGTQHFAKHSTAKSY